MTITSEHTEKATCLVFYGKDIIRTTATGAVDLEATKNRLRELATPDEPVVCEAMFDLRGAPGRLVPSDLNALAEEMGRIDRRFVGRIAFLFDEGDEAPAEATTSPDGRYQVAHFVDFDEAMHWLTAGPGCGKTTPGVPS